MKTQNLIKLITCISLLLISFSGFAQGIPSLDGELLVPHNNEEDSSGDNESYDYDANTTSQPMNLDPIEGISPPDIEQINRIREQILKKIPGLTYTKEGNQFKINITNIKQFANWMEEKQILTRETIKKITNLKLFSIIYFSVEDVNSLISDYIQSVKNNRFVSLNASLFYNDIDTYSQRFKLKNVNVFVTNDYINNGIAPYSLSYRYLVYYATLIGCAYNMRIKTMLEYQTIFLNKVVKTPDTELDTLTFGLKVFWEDKMHVWTNIVRDIGKKIDDINKNIIQEYRKYYLPLNLEKNFYNMLEEIYANL